MAITLTPETRQAVRVLVLANRDCVGAPLLRRLVSLAGAPALDVHVVAPALRGRVDLWTDDDRGYRAAAERLRRSLAACTAAGLPAAGEIGDADPVQALDDALAVHAADLVVVVTHPYDDANWLERGVVAAARERHPELDVHHVVVGSAGDGLLVDAEIAEWRWGIRAPARLLDHVLLWGTALLALFGSLLWVLGGEITGASEGALIGWAIAVDLGFKALLALVVVLRFLVRAPADRNRL